MKNSFFLLMLPILALSLGGQTQTRTGLPHEEKVIEWIKPTTAELSWQTLPWLESFGAGILASDKEEKPLLLWVMNGHPLGCT